jgi:hypothetical protein
MSNILLYIVLQVCIYFVLYQLVSGLSLSSINLAGFLSVYFSTGVDHDSFIFKSPPHPGTISYLSNIFASLAWTCTS